MILYHHGKTLKKCIINHSMRFGFEDDLIMWIKDHVKIDSTCEKFIFFAIKSDAGKLDKILLFLKLA